MVSLLLLSKALLRGSAGGVLAGIGLFWQGGARRTVICVEIFLPMGSRVGQPTPTHSDTDLSARTLFSGLFLCIKFRDGSKILGSICVWEMISSLLNLGEAAFGTHFFFALHWEWEGGLGRHTRTTAASSYTCLTTTTFFCHLTTLRHTLSRQWLSWSLPSRRRRTRALFCPGGR